MDSKLAVIIGVGVNNLAIPLVVLESKENAVALVRELTGVHESYTTPDGIACWSLPDDVCEDASNPLWDKLLLSYPRYFGCGGCYSLEVHEIELGKPLVGWDLD